MDAKRSLSRRYGQILKVFGKGVNVFGYKRWQEMGKELLGETYGSHGG
jgi:hypothetical protein